MTALTPKPIPGGAWTLDQAVALCRAIEAVRTAYYAARKLAERFR